MASKFLILCQIMIIFTLFSSRVCVVTDYVTNGDFSLNSCGSIAGDYTCQGNSVLTGWTAKKISDSSTSPLSVQDKTYFSSFSVSVSKVVPLDYLEPVADGSGRQYKRTCIQQVLSSALDAGTYQLTFEAATRSN